MLPSSALSPPPFRCGWDCFVANEELIYYSGQVYIPRPDQRTENIVANHMLYSATVSDVAVYGVVAQGVEVELRIHIIVVTPRKKKVTLDEVVVTRFGCWGKKGCFWRLKPVRLDKITKANLQCTLVYLNFFYYGFYFYYGL